MNLLAASITHWSENWIMFLSIAALCGFIYWLTTLAKRGIRMEQAYNDQAKSMIDQARSVAQHTAIETAYIERILSMTEKAEVQQGKGFLCARDLMYQYLEGQFSETYEAWEEWLKTMAEDHSGTLTQRNGAWVPAIPL